MKYLSLFWTFQLPFHNVLSSRKTHTSDFCYCTKERKKEKKRNPRKIDFEKTPDKMRYTGHPFTYDA